MSTARRVLSLALLLACLLALAVGAAPQAAAPEKSAEGQAAALGIFSYEDFEADENCAMCHADITAQMHQSLMSECFTHHWDEIEYFELALPHARKLEKVSGIEAGCISCHSPLAFLAGDIPPSRPAENTRANEAISCDTCHTMVGFEGDIPYNGNYIIRPGSVKSGTRGGGAPGMHEIEVNPFLETTEFCGTCHNEKDPYGVWVKATQIEWKEGPYGGTDITCQACHMTPGPGNAAPAMGGRDVPDLAHHLFHGAHEEAKLKGAVEVRVRPREETLRAGEEQVVVANVLNAKAGHMIPSGSVEERVVWLHVEARDATGKVHHLPVDRKGFEGEEMTIASADAMAYQDIGDIKGIEDFPGLLRDAGVPAGDRIFRMPYLDPEGRMTIAQWHTASLGPDYRLPPLETITETFTWTLPEDLPAGEVEVRASVWYCLLVPSVAEYMGVPEEETVPVEMSSHETSFVVAPKS